MSLRQDSDAVRRSGFTDFSPLLCLQPMSSDPYCRAQNRTPSLRFGRRNRRFIELKNQRSAPRNCPRRTPFAPSFGKRFTGETRLLAGCFGVQIGSAVSLRKRFVARRNAPELHRLTARQEQSVGTLSRRNARGFALNVDEKSRRWNSVSRPLPRSKRMSNRVRFWIDFVPP